MCCPLSGFVYWLRFFYPGFQRFSFEMIFGAVRLFRVCVLLLLAPLVFEGEIRNTVCSLRTGPLSSDGSRESGEREGKEGLHALHCSSSILRPEFGRKIPIG